MPENTTEKPTELALSQETPNAKNANAKVATELADQGRESLDATHIETESLETGEALNELRDKISKEKADAAAKADEEVDAVEKKDEKDATSSVAPDATIAPAKTDAVIEVTPDKPAATDDIFKDISLPANIKPKSAEAFEKVKALGREQIAARDAKVADLEKQLNELQAKTKDPVPEEFQKELEEHRNFRTKFDIEADPKFKTYDKDIADTHNFIYAQLLKTGKITQENIDQIRKYGGPSKVNLEKIFEAINDPTVKRIVESKVADEEMLLFKKEQAIKEKKDDVAGYLKEREENFIKSATAHNEATKKQFSAITAKLDWIKERPLPKDANDAVKAEVKTHNEFVASTRKDLEAALHDDSPDMRAILLAGMGQLINLQRVHEGVNAELAATKKQLEEATGKLEKIKSASKSRLPESAAPVGVKTVEVKKDDFSTPTIDALENIRKDIMTKRAEKANA